MKIKFNQWAAVKYSEIFDWPLTLSEAKIWAVNSDNQKEKCFEFKPNTKLLELRKQREKTSIKKIKKVGKILTTLRKIPSVQAIFLTGSTAVGNSQKDSDIDLMIITSPNTLWLTRAIIFLYLKSLKSLKSPQKSNNQICPNIFLDTNHLKVQEKNLYTAHEILQAKCLFDRYNINYLWLKRNSWTKHYLPNAYATSLRALAKQSHTNPNKFASSLIFLAMTFIELISFFLQYFYMKRKITNESVGFGFAFFHPNQLGKKIESEFKKRLVK